MAWLHHTTHQASVQRPYRNLQAAFREIDARALLAHLEAHRYHGRHGYPVAAMWRSYLASFFLNLASTNDLIRRLHGDPALREACGFRVLPGRRTFNRFIRTLSRHHEMVEALSAGITAQLHSLLPDLGQEVAVDSTVVRSHSNPNRRRISDPEASWTAKNSPRAREGGKEWSWGYKVHLVACANYGLPLAQVTTTARRNDSPVLPVVMDKTRAALPWLQPKAAIADRGYDAASNHRYLDDHGVLPIIHIKRNAQNALRDGIYTRDGIPTCLGRVPMEYRGSDPQKGHRYMCRAGGCHMMDSRRGIRYCQDEVWEDPRANIRLFGVLRRGSPEWKALYSKRQAIERTFKSMKQSRRLERHCTRGLRMVQLHALMSTLAYQVTALAAVRVGELDTMRWQVWRVA